MGRHLRRYSHDTLNKDNVGKHSCGHLALGEKQHSQETQPLVYDGMMYIQVRILVYMQSM